VSLAQLEGFVAIAEEGTITRAARRLRISQPPLTRKIHALEDELGVRLFQRGARGVVLSAAGEKLLEHARDILGRVARAREVVGSPL